MIGEKSGKILKRTCARCLIDETVPGIVVDRKGVCSLCRQSSSLTGQEALQSQRSHFALEFRKEVEILRRSREKYHAVLALSGGKDSSYLAWLLTRKYKLKVLAVTVNTGFSGDAAIRNAAFVTRSLCIDHVVLNERRFFSGVYKETFRNGFFSSSDGLPCAVCAQILPFMICRYAGKKGIRLVLSGKFDPDQPKLWDNESRPLSALVTRFLGDKYSREDIRTKEVKIVYPLNTLMISESKIFRVLKKEFGIDQVKQFRSEITACEIVHASMILYKQAKGYNPHLPVIGALIRSGYFDRKEWRGRLEKVDQYLATAEARGRALKVLADLGLTGSGTGISG